MLSYGMRVHRTCVWKIHAQAYEVKKVRGDGGISDDSLRTAESRNV